MLTTYENAIQKISSLAASRTLSKEVIPLSQAVGRVLADSVVSKVFVPPFDNSSMDGFAIRSQEYLAGVRRFHVIGRSLPGQVPLETQEHDGQAIEIMTGAPMPKGFDSIIRVEDVVENRDGFVSFQNLALKSGQWVRYRGEDFKPGDLLASHGDFIDSKRLMGFAALGVREFPVHRMPKIWIASTGQELVEVDAATIPEGTIRNATAPFLIEELKAMGAEIHYQGIISDEGAHGSKCFEEFIRAALMDQADVIVTTGAVSMGIHDFISDGLKRVGADIAFHRVAIKPGKPLLCAEFPKHPKTVFMGLPGNPMSTVVGVDFFLKPYLRKIFGMSEPREWKARLKGKVRKPEGLRTFLKARVESTSDGALEVQVLDGQGSFMISSLDHANAWAVFPESGAEFLPGSFVQIDLFKERISWNQH